MGLAVSVFSWRLVASNHAVLSARLDEAELQAGAVVAARGERRTLRFSDGSDVALSSGQLRVRTLAENGARIALDDGNAEVYVVHTPRTHWSFDAGPFEVDVIGTSFGLAWDQARRSLDVRFGCSARAARRAQLERCSRSRYEIQACGSRVGDADGAGWGRGSHAGEPALTVESRAGSRQLRANRG
jgi:ferric-dicitrate binding protein FerR (iron transport regulator)